MSDSPPRLVPSQDTTTDQPQFTLRGLLALIAAVAAFLAIGIRFSFGWSVIALLVPYFLLMTWRKRSIADFCIVALLSLVVIAAFSLMTPAIMGPREAPPHVQCQNNMREIAQAILSFQNAKGHLPPPYLADKDGTPLCSWRVLILPYLERSDITDLWKFDEPWDSPNNQKLSDTYLAFFSCPGDRNIDKSKCLTSYAAVVGPGTAWEEDTKLNTASFKDGAGNTLLLVELKDSDIHWAEPRDLYFGQMATVNNPKQGQGISSKHKGGTVGIFADKRVTFIRDDTMPNILKALLTRDGGEAVSPADFENQYDAQMSDWPADTDPLPVTEPMPADQPQFTLRGLLAAVAVVAIFMAFARVLGVFGAVFYFGIVCLACFIGRQEFKSRVERLALSTLIAGIVLAIFLPAIENGRSRPRPPCQNNLRQIAIALLNYESENGHLPPPYVADAEGKPLYSWRVLILPYLERRDIMDQWKLGEPWDSPNNKLLSDVYLDIFRCPSDVGDGTRKALTNYVAVVGPGTAWEEGTKLNTASFKDGAGHTLLLVEIADSDIHWAEPRDLNFGKMAMTINPATGPGISSKHSGGTRVAFADSGITSIRDNTMPNVLKALLTREGRESVSEDEYGW